MFEIALSVPSLRRQHAVTINTEISQSKHEEAAQAFLYLAYTLLEPNFSDFHDIVHSSEVAVMAASREEKNSAVRVRTGNLIPVNQHSIFGKT